MELRILDSNFTVKQPNISACLVALLLLSTEPSQMLFPSARDASHPQGPFVPGNSCSASSYSCSTRALPLRKSQD